VIKETRIGPGTGARRITGRATAAATIAAVLGVGIADADTVLRCQV
jgi:hypothetical protein